ncbi:MAG: TA system VapC family ribonuclease toxin [Bryobacteraceae bacterium]
MTLTDANILLYAFDPSSAQHAKCRRWLEKACQGSELVLLCWPVILAFLRISTNPLVFETPLSMEEAAAVVTNLLEQPAVRVIQPGEDHWRILAGLLRTSQARGSLVMDAHLAALAMEHGATVCTTDRDFSRFEKLKVFSPVG